MKWSETYAVAENTTSHAVITMTAMRQSISSSHAGEDDADQAEQRGRDGNDLDQRQPVGKLVQSFAEFMHLPLPWIR